MSPPGVLWLLTTTANNNNDNNNEYIGNYIYIYIILNRLQ